MPSDTPIQPLLIGDEQTALAASSFLQQQGILVLAIRPPTVPDGSSRLRFTITTAHETSSINRLIDVLASEAMESVMAQNAVPNTSHN